MTTGTGTYQTKEVVYQSPNGTYANATRTAVLQNWDITSKTLTVTNIQGEFLNNQVVIGLSSNAQFTLSTFDTLETKPHNEIYDNKYIENSANLIIDWSESNPFGQI
jgi:hypothetical protein